MKKIFIDSADFLPGSEIPLDNEDFYHLTKALRVKKGESFIIGNSSGREYNGIISTIAKKHLTITIGDEYKRAQAKSPSITLFFSILKGDKNDSLIRQCSEIGIDRFVPVLTRNSIVQLDQKKRDHKLTRWKKIAREAAMQCGKQKVSEINSIINLEDSIKYDKKEAYKIIAYYDCSTTIHSYLEKLDKPAADVFLFIGPEGDFDKSEVAFLMEYNWECVFCHPHILRSETAALYIGSILHYELSG